MTEAAAMFTRILGTTTAATQEQKMMFDILYNNNITLQMGDKRLNNITALTWNSEQCANIFSLLEKSLNPEKYPWQTLHKSILLLHTITIYGSEIAIDACIGLFRTIDKLQGYNSALVKQGGFFAVGGTDYGAPVREAAKTLVGILVNDDNIRQARQAASQTDSLVPMGEDFDAIANAAAGKSNAADHGFGQGMQKSSLGAGFDLSQVPGMYENRPDRYFDDKMDPRQNLTVGDHQHTREAMNNESLLDLVFDTGTSDQDDSASSSLPETTDYLPGLARQKELEAQLAAQQQQLQQLQMLAQQQQQQQQQMQQQSVQLTSPQMNTSHFQGQQQQQMPSYGQQQHQQQPDNVFNNFQSQVNTMPNMNTNTNMNMNMNTNMSMNSPQQMQQMQPNMQASPQQFNMQGQQPQMYQQQQFQPPYQQQQFQQQQPQYQQQQFQPQYQQQPMNGQQQGMQQLNPQPQPGTE